MSQLNKFSGTAIKGGGAFALFALIPQLGRAQV
jgi:hypothetical protein